jgi:hypothetical protein
MTTFNKEQLIARINQATAINKLRISRDPDADGLAMDNELLAIALASLEAEAVACPKCNGTGMADSGGTHPWGEPISIPCDCTAPPAPVSVPDEATPGNIEILASTYAPRGVTYQWYRDECNAAADSWNACRAAMLHGADGNSPVIHDGWVACSERMPKKNDKVLIFIDFNSEYVPPSIHDAEFTGATFRRGGATVNVFPLEDGYGVTHWQPLPSPPFK